MPEGDTVWLAAARLRAVLAGQRLTRAELRVPRLAGADLTGRTVLDVRARGKHLLFALSGDLTLRTHLGMAGEWRVTTQTTPRGIGPDDVRVLLGTATHTALGYRLVRVDLLRTRDEDRVLGHLGPDLAADEFDADAARRRLAASPDRPLAEALLDQRVMAGVGNAFRSEIMFVLGLAPGTRVGDVADLAAVVRVARDMLLANRNRPARTTAGDLRPAERLWVYGRADRPCRRCGTTVVRQRDRTGRSLYVCPACQTVPGSAAAGSARQTVPTRWNPSRS